MHQKKKIYKSCKNYNKLQNLQNLLKKLQELQEKVLKEYGARLEMFDPVSNNTLTTFSGNSFSFSVRESLIKEFKYNYILVYKISAKASSIACESFHQTKYLLMRIYP